MSSRNTEPGDPAAGEGIGAQPLQGSAASSQGELVLYATDDGAARLYLRAEGGTVWLTQLELAQLFQTTKQNISFHINNILGDRELPEATVKDYLTVQTEGLRRVRRRVQSCNLDMILAIGYRVKSPRGTQFRQWATTQLKQYLLKGFVLDDERLKDPAGADPFNELVLRIRDIRASEQRFYQKVRDVFALSVDYKDDAESAAMFFASVQNKMLFAVTGKTAAEIVVSRADPAQANFNLTAWRGGRVHKSDVIVAKNYLVEAELAELNRIVNMFLDYAEDRASQRQNLRMDDWRAYVDRFVEFNERPLLKTAGSVSHEQMVKQIEPLYLDFDTRRRKVEREAADAQDLRELEAIEKQERSRVKERKPG